MLNNDFYFVETIGSNIKDNDIKAKPNNINTVSSTSNDLSIGKPYAGGIIFYIDETGEHGLIAAPSDQGTTGIQWYNGSNVETGATGTSIGTGQANTSAIVAVQGAGSYAAKVCDDLVLGGYSDWFLPSRDELNLMYTNLEVNGLGGFGSFSYWSSSEYDSTYAWKQSFGFGYQNCQNYGNKFYTYYVRAVRAF